MQPYLAEACQNTFVLFDCLHMERLDQQTLALAHRCLQEEGRDDALLLVGGRMIDGAFSSQMVVLGPDGALGEYCGNGARACAAYLFANYGSRGTLVLRTGDFVHRLTQLGQDQFSVTLPTPRFEVNSKFVTSPDAIAPFRYVEAIEPHLVLETAMSDEELLAAGRRLNQQKELFPLGINLNVYRSLPNGALSVTTYERGVQRLTKACGTGSISCSAAFLNGRLGTVHVVTPGGPLQIIFREGEIELCGEGKFKE